MVSNEKDDLENKCIDSFYENMDDYEIIEWDESNIDLGPLTKSEFGFNTFLKDLFANNDDSLDNSKIISVLNYNIYPTEYFCPVNRITQEVCITNNTVSIHHFNSSWQR